MNTEKVKIKNKVKRYKIPPTWEHWGRERYEGRINISFTAKGKPSEIETLLSEILELLNK